MQSSIAECNISLMARNTLADGKLLQIKSGAEPDIDGSASGSVLIQYTLKSPAFNAASGRVATLDIPAPVTATGAGAGLPYHYVILDGATVLRSGAIGTDMILSTDTWSIGDDVTISAYGTTQPK